MRIAVLISGNGSNLQALIDACKAGRVAGELVGVISNKSMPLVCSVQLRQVLEPR